MVARSAPLDDARMSDSRQSEAAFETVISAHLLANGYVLVAAVGFDRDRTIFKDTVLAFIRETQPVQWARLDALHVDKTGDIDVQGGVSLNAQA